MNAALRPTTVLVSDLKGSTALAEQFDAETLRLVMTRYFDAMSAVVESSGGVVVKIIGDAIVATFELAADAVRAALDGADVLRSLNERFEATWGVTLQNRTGIASGDVVLDERGVLTGEVVRVAEALEAAAPVGGALVDAVTLDRMGSVAATVSFGVVPGRSVVGELAAWQLVSLDPAESLPDRERGADDPSWALGAAAASSASAPASENRRTVTIVFADPRPTHPDGRTLDDDVMRTVMARYFEVVAPVIERHGGTVEKFIGDALMAVFGLVVRHEDDAVRAIRAASELQVVVARLNDELQLEVGVRISHPIGVNTGPVVAGDASTGQRLVTGDAVNAAARLEQTAADGDVVIGGATAHLAGDAAVLEPLEPLQLKGKREPVAAFRVVRLVGGGATRRHELPMIGRDRELAAMRAVFDGSVATGRAARLTVVGDAGVGKSRVIHEFLDQVGRTARVLHGNCLAYGDGITFWPLLRVVQAAAGVNEDDQVEVARERVRALVADAGIGDRLESVAGLVTTPFPVAELVWSVRRLLEDLSAISPLVVVVDDLHWAEPVLLDALDELTRTVVGPLTILGTARPTVIETHGEFVEGAPVLSIEPLSDDDCERFLRLLLGDHDVDRSVVRRVLDAVGGNPLFLEQLLSMLIDEGRLESTGGGWRLRGDLDSLEVPATVEALLAARLDLLPPDARRTIGPASVIGRHFAVDALRHIIDAGLVPGSDANLVELERRDLITPEPDDDPAYRFQHQLIRDATYQGLLKQSRAVLHEQMVTWAEGRNAERGRSTEFDEILGYHLEQAYRYWGELGPLDDHAVDLGRRGSDLLCGAGERALARGDMPAAANLLSRAAALIVPPHPALARRLLLAGRGLHETGAFDAAIESYDRSAAAAHEAGDLGGAVGGRIERVRLQYLIGRIEDPEVVPREIEAALAQLGTTDGLSGPPDALCRIWQLRLNLHIEACRWAAAQEAAERVIEFARLAGNHVLAVRTVPLLAFLVQKGPMPVPEATPACEAILEEVSGDLRSTSLVHLELAMLSAMSLDLDRARALCDATRSTLGDLGWDMQAALVSLSSGPIELLADEPARAERELRRDFDALDRMDERNFISLTAVLLAEAVLRQGRVDEARELVERSRDIAAPDDLAVQILLCTVGGKLAAAAGDSAGGLALVDEGVAMMEDTDDPSGLGDALLDRAEVLFLHGDRSAATDVCGQARACYERKGNQAGIRRADGVAARFG